MTKSKSAILKFFTGSAEDSVNQSSSVYAVKIQESSQSKNVLTALAGIVEMRQMLDNEGADVTVLRVQCAHSSVQLWRRNIAELPQ